MLRVVSVKPSASKIVLQLCFRARYVDICLCVYVRVFLSLFISLSLNLSFCRSFCVSVLPHIFWWVSKQCPVVMLLALLWDVASSFALFFRWLAEGEGSLVMQQDTGFFYCGQKKQVSGKALSSPSHHLLSSSALPHVHFCHCIMKYCADLVLWPTCWHFGIKNISSIILSLTMENHPWLLEYISIKISHFCAIQQYTNTHSKLLKLSHLKYIAHN